MNPVVHFEIPADDPDKLANFYSKVFEWNVKRASGGIAYWTIETMGSRARSESTAAC